MCECVQVKWYKDRRELTKYDYTMTHSDGVITMEILDCKPEDSGKYSCVAKNVHGEDETGCVVIVEGESHNYSRTTQEKKFDASECKEW